MKVKHSRPNKIRNIVYLVKLSKDKILNRIRLANFIKFDTRILVTKVKSKQIRIKNIKSLDTM